MIIAADQKLITVAEFEAILAANSDRLLELIHGEIVEKMPTQRHGITAHIIHGELYIYFNQHPDTGRAGGEIRYQVPDDKYNDRIPDISVDLDTTSPIVEKGSMPKMPDFAIEIKSPDDSYKKMRDKAAYYLENGTRLVWLIYPEKQLVEVYQAGSDMDFKTIEDTLDGGEVLPGFELPVKKLFPQR